jgi:hypothetical protein
MGNVGQISFGRCRSVWWKSRFVQTLDVTK